MARPKTITDEQLFDCAREMFLTHGPSTTVQQIAQQLNVSHAALFQRVGTKEQLLLRALNPQTPQALEALFDHYEPVGVAELNALLFELTRFLKRVLPNLVVLRCAGLGPQAPAHELPPHRLRVGLAAWLARWLQTSAQASTQALAEGLLGAIEARCFNAYLASHEQDDSADLDFIEALTAGLLGTAQQEPSRG